MGVPLKENALDGEKWSRAKRRPRGGDGGGKEDVEIVMFSNCPLVGPSQTLRRCRYERRQRENAIADFQDISRKLLPRSIAYRDVCELKRARGFSISTRSKECLYRAENIEFRSNRFRFMSMAIREDLNFLSDRSQKV